MRRPRVVLPDARAGSRLPLGPSDARHLAVVLKLRPGREIEVLDGAGGRFLGIYLGGAPPAVEVQDRSPGGEDVEPITVALAAVKPSRMDWAAEKLSELGARAMVPLVSARGTAAPRLERLRRIAVESSKQCGRGTLLEVTAPLTLEALAGRLGTGASRLLLDPRGAPLAADDVAGGEVALVVGPEGGLTSEERVQATALGFRPVRIAGPVLRSETAAVAGTAAVIALRAAAAAAEAGEAGGKDGA